VWVECGGLGAAPVRARALCVEIRDPGPGQDREAPGTGVGIRGMRERVAATGAQFGAEPTSGGGFAIRAEWSGSG
jgi:signal transduction histidine kinase